MKDGKAGGGGSVEHEVVMKKIKLDLAVSFFLKKDEGAASSLFNQFSVKNINEIWDLAMEDRFFKKVYLCRLFSQYKEKDVEKSYQILIELAGQFAIKTVKEIKDIDIMYDFLEKPKAGQTE